MRHGAADLDHLRDVARCFLDRDDSRHAAQADERRHVDVAAGPARHVVDDDRQADLAGNRAVVLEEAFGRRLVVVRRHGEDAAGAGLLHPPRRVDDFLRVVAAGAGQHRDACRRLPRRPARRLGRARPRSASGFRPSCRTARENECRHRSAAWRAAGRAASSTAPLARERRDQRRSAPVHGVRMIKSSSEFHDSSRRCEAHDDREAFRQSSKYYSKPSTSLIENQPRRPCHPARSLERAAREDRAVAGRVRQRNRLGGPSKPTVWVPGIDPARVDATSIGAA